MDNYYRKTKIICTIGPATSDLDTLRKMYDAGMNIARLNMSHGDHKTYLPVIQNIKSLNRNTQNPIAILADTQGPEIRTGNVKENYMLNVGEMIEIAVSGANDNESSSRITVNYQSLIDDLNTGDRITVDNGLINLDVIEKSDFGLKCRVVDGGMMKSRRHINLPGIRVNLPSITAKDEEDILFAIKHDIDFVALSFVREAAVVTEARHFIQRHGGHAQIIAKIEDRSGVENMAEIIQISDGVMVARGDLGVEVPIEELPIIQRKIIKLTAESGKKCIIATHLLESMIENPLPTRAEVTDVANAAFEEADCVMLSAETSIGKHPVKSVEYLDKICKRIERSGGIQWASQRIPHGHKETLAKAAVSIADTLQASAIFVFTRRGIMADFVTSFHPKYPVIFAFTNMTTVRRRLVMNRGCYPLRIEFSNDPEKTIQNAIKIILKKKLLNMNDTIVIVSDILAGNGRVDAIQIRTISGEKI